MSVVVSFLAHDYLWRDWHTSRSLLWSRFNVLAPPNVYITVVGVCILCILLRNLFEDCYRSCQLPPKSPSSVPYIGNAISLLSGPRRLASTLLSHCGTFSPIRFNIFGFNLILVRGCSHVRTVLNTHDIFVFNKLQATFLHKALGISTQAAAVIADDDSGFGIKPLPSSKIPPNRRILRMQHENTFIILSRTGVAEMTTQFINSFEERFMACEVGDKSVQIPDLYHFLRKLSFGSMMDTLCGPELLRLSPDFEKYFWQYDYHIDYLMKYPAFLQSRARNARSRCLEAMSEWRQFAILKSHGTEYSGSRMWHRTWGMKCMRLRHEMYDLFPEFDDTTRSACDFAVIWAANVNAVPVFYWFLLPLLQRPSLLKQCRLEMERALLPHEGKHFRRFNDSILLQQPTLQSVLSEALRLSVTMHLVRSTSQNSHLGPFLIPHNSAALVSCHIEHMDRSVWGTRKGAEFHTMDEFWPERFLTPAEPASDAACDSAAEPEFTTDGLETSFIPFGGGIHECPGRNFAKRAILTVAAMLLDAYEIELTVPEGWKQNYDLHAYGYSTLRPAIPTPVRIKEKPSYGCVDTPSGYS